ncbi:MAG: hypothetical protein LUH07_04880 [Lachnospiraceae bacterium]|nr:hypothetical protein [Lachnospiraceae bacterium]
MSQIICPYCCKRFSPTRMVFRLKHSLQEKPQEEQQDQWGMGTRMDQKIVDEKLKKYYMDIENIDERTAEQYASVDAEAIEINFADMMADITDYNTKLYSEQKFVLELTYKGQRLTERLCPECHNELIPNAGLYDMKIIAMYGDTYAGKTVYLNILEAALGGDPHLNSDACAFQGSMFFQGNDTELEEHDKNYDMLLIDHSLPGATPGGQIVHPQVFRYCYNTADRQNDDKNLLLVFRDIPGEDTKSAEKMKKYAFYLKNADGIIVLLDSSKLTHVVPYLQAEGSSRGKTKVAQAISNLSDLLAAQNGGDRIAIPTAVVLAKADVLEAVPMPEVSEVYHNVINVSDADNKHINYMNRKTIRELDRAVRGILKSLNESATIVNPVDHCFSEYSYFALSALGENPTDQDGVKVVQKLRPFRVAEPFYWLLSKMDCIPYYHVERWRSNKGVERELRMYYYERERKGIAQKRLEDQKNAQGIKNSFFGPKWEMVGQNDAI